MEVRVTSVTKTRTLKDGTVKAYTSKKTYKVKNGVDDKRITNSEFANLSDESKTTIRQRRSDGVSLKRLCDDYKIGYSTIVKVVNGEAVK
jgi:hypothetical protein